MTPRSSRASRRLVRDRHPMGVAGQIGEHRRRPGEGALGIDDPFALRAAARAIAANARASASPAYSPKNCSRPPRCAVAQFFEEATAEQPREHAHRQEEARPAGDPALAVGGEATAGQRCRAHADGASAPSPRYAGPASRRPARRDASGRRRWCAASRAATANSRS